MKRTFAFLRLSEIKNWILPEQNLDYLEERIVLDKIQRHEFFFHFIAEKYLFVFFYMFWINKESRNKPVQNSYNWIFLVRSLNNLGVVIYGSLL